jgi:hypothetical protein
MMKKKFALKTLFCVVLGIGIVSAAIMDPQTRMEKIADLFSNHNPQEVFMLLNGQDIGGTGGAEAGKGTQRAVRSDIASVIHSEDRNAFVFCVANGKWAVYQPDPLKIGKDAMTMTDADGKPFVASQIAAMQKSSNGKAVVPYTDLTPDGVKENREAIIWSSKTLLSRKNDTGQKFYCGTSRLR